MRALDKFLDLSSSTFPKKDWSQQSLWSLSSGSQASIPACHAGVGKWGWAKLLGGWVVGGRGSGSSYLSHPPLVAHVGADPLPARKSQTQRSDIWEVLGSQGIFRRPEADMPRILGVAEPKKLGGQWRVNQKRWPQSWFLLHYGQLVFLFPRGQCSGLLCTSSGYPDLPLNLLPSGSSGAELLQSLSGRMCPWSPLIPSASYLVVQVNCWALGI